MRFPTVLAAIALSLSLPISAEAHRAWMLPSATVLSGDAPWVTVDLAISNDIFYFEHFPMRLDNVQAIGPDGNPVEIKNSHTGRYRSTIDIELTQKGTYRIQDFSSSLMASYKLDGEQKRWRGSEEEFKTAIPKGAKEVKVSQNSRRVETFVTAGAPTMENLKPSNQGLELVPTTHPNDLFAGEAAEFQFLIDGKPAANMEVLIIREGIRYRNSLDEIKLMTDSDGKITVTWSEPGMYWLSASLQDDKPSITKAQTRRASYAATIEVLAQ